MHYFRLQKRLFLWELCQYIDLSRAAKEKKSLLTSSLLWLIGKAARFHWRGRQFKPRSWPKVGRHWIGRNEITRFCKINRRLLFKPKQSQVQATKKPFQSTSKFMQFEASALSNKMAFFWFHYRKSILKPLLSLDVPEVIPLELSQKPKSKLWNWQWWSWLDIWSALLLLSVFGVTLSFGSPHSTWVLTFEIVVCNALSTSNTQRNLNCSGCSEMVVLAPDFK